MIDHKALLKRNATQIRIQFGTPTCAFIELRSSEGAWAVYDDRRRYPHEVVASLTLEDAIRKANEICREETEKK